MLHMKLHGKLHCITSQDNAGLFSKVAGLVYAPREIREWMNTYARRIHYFSHRSDKYLPEGGNLREKHLVLVQRLVHQSKEGLAKCTVVGASGGSTSCLCSS